MRQIFEKTIARDEYGEDWKVIQIGGGQEKYSCYCSHDCCGHSFCWLVKTYLWGLITVGYYGINV
jgi:hypothetical protein